MDMLLKWSTCILFLRYKFNYIRLLHCTIKTPKWHWTLKRQRYPINMFTATPDFQISLRFSLRTSLFELQGILTQVHQMTPKWPWTLKYQSRGYHYKTWVYWHTFEMCLYFRQFRFSKLAYLSMKFSHWQKFQKLHIYTLFLSHGVDMKLNVPSTGSGFPKCRPIFKIVIFRHDTWPPAKVPEVAHILPKLPTSPKFHPILLCGWHFQTHWQFFTFPLATMWNFNLF